MSPAPLADELVSVVIPAFNAAATIRGTVVSALNQTHENIEIIVVDDGSTDQTKSIVMALAQGNDRVRYFYKSNGGVAAARNFGIAESRGSFVATLDADDLWYHTKIERQLERLARSSPETALVYAWCCWVDDSGYIIGDAVPTRLEGQLLAPMCLGNIIVSGSNALIRRDVLIELGGFDETLRSRGGQGCEDWKLYLQIADRYEIALVPEYLVGYCVTHESMSDDFKQMMRSRQLVESEFVSLYPDLAPHFTQGRTILARALALRAIERRQFRSAVELLTNQSGGKLVNGFWTLLWLFGGFARRFGRRMRKGNRATRESFLAMR